MASRPAPRRARERAPAARFGPAPFSEGDLPPKPHGFLKLVGPGAVLVGLAIGAGELIVWPVTTARFGAGLTWAAMLGVLLQLVINVEVGRYTLATGESVYSAFARMGRGWVPAFLVLNVVGWILPGWARTCGGAVKALAVGIGGPGAPWVWTALTFAAVGVVLLGPEHVYAAVERTTVTLVAFMLVGLTIIALRIGTLGAAADLARGIVDVGYKPPELPTYELFSAIVFAGAGGTTNLMLSYYLLGKGWGMGARGGPAYRVTDTPINRQRWRAWLSHMAMDQAIFFWIMNSITILLFIFAALVVLHAEGIVPSREMLVLQEATMLERIWGAAGADLFMVIGIACLFSTQLTLLDGVARSCADLIHTNYPAARRYPFRVWYRGIALAWMVAGTWLTWAWGRLPPFVFLLSAGFFGGIAMAVYCPLLWVANATLLPEHCRPGLVQRVTFGTVALVYVAFAVVSLGVVAGQMIGG
jgi:hypothetical protein